MLVADNLRASIEENLYSTANASGSMTAAVAEYTIRQIVDECDCISAYLLTYYPGCDKLVEELSDGKHRRVNLDSIRPEARRRLERIRTAEHESGGMFAAVVDLIHEYLLAERKLVVGYASKQIPDAALFSTMINAGAHRK